MRSHATALLLGLAVFAATGAAEAGGVIGRACLGAGRPAATRELCACIQKVADATLTASEQRRGAAFFGNPHQSQEVRASSRPADARFWAHWEQFGATADAYCR